MKTTPTIRRRRQAGFTLLELAIVILIMLVLAGLLLRAARIASDRAKLARCKAELSNLRVAIDQYYKDARRYPENNSSLVSSLLLGARTYVDWPASRVTPQGFLDPWGRAYVYSRSASGLDFHGLGIAQPYNLTSYGPDSIAGNGDDISLTKLPTN
jgi:general secretion pathway protein G